MNDIFIINACDVLGDTNLGLSGSEIVKYCISYANQYDVEIPHCIYPFGTKVPNKRTALKDNMLKFSRAQQFEILKQLCELSKFEKNNDIQKLKLQITNHFTENDSIATDFDISQSQVKMTKKITGITYRNIIDVLNVGSDGENIKWNGRLNEVEFLSRLYELEKLASTDKRFKNANEDIWQHTINNEDYELKDILEYEGFNIKNGDDMYLLNFLCEVFHPEVRKRQENFMKIFVKLNKLIICDGYEMYEKDYISNHAVYGWRVVEKISSNCENDYIETKQSEGVNKMIEEKIFISHSSKDAAYGQILVDLLKYIGLKREQIIFTSNPMYGIPINENIFDYLKSQLKNKMYVLYLLSDNYYSSVACLNEMGATWIVQNEYTPIFTPNFDFQNLNFLEGAIDPRQMGFSIDNKQRIIQFKNIVLDKFKLEMDELEWNDAFDKYIEKINKIKA